MEKTIMRRIAFVTGAGGFIGSAVAYELARNGVTVAVADIDEGSVSRVTRGLRAKGYEARGYICDVTESKSVDEAMNLAAKELGGIDIMVHVAGGSARIAGEGAKYVTLVEQEDYVIDRVLKVTLYGAIYASRAAARIMIAQGRGGRIINFSSVVGFNGLKYCTEYAASKGGVMSLTRSLAKELGEYGITVNSVAPGVVIRPEEDMGEGYEVNTNFLGRQCKAEDVADLVGFLASDKAGFITGQIYAIDGGRSLAMKGTD